MRNPISSPVLAAAARGLVGLSLGCQPQPTTSPGETTQLASGPPGSIDTERLERADVLERHALVCAVLERNPDLAAAHEALASARARARQPVGLGNTRLAWSVAPISIGADVPFGHVLELEQSFRLGQRGIERRVAGTEADAVAHRRDAMRNELAYAAALSYDEHYELARALEINAEQHTLVEQLVESTTRRYAAGVGSAQDPLQAQLELARIEQERVELQASRRIAIAQTNRLLHRPPDAPLPPPPKRLDEPDELHDPARLHRDAIGARPELRAAASEAEAREQATTLARRRFAPELSAMASYNSMWSDAAHRFMVGVGVSLPLQIGGLKAGVAEARAEHRRADRLVQAERDRIATQVEEALVRVSAAAEIVELHRDKLVPTARARVEAARIGYETGANDLDTLIDAARELRDLELASERALAELDRRRAELDWAVGRAPCASAEVQL